MNVCRNCGITITWGVVDASGKRMPIDAAASEDGNVVWINERHVHVLKRGERDAPEYADKPRFHSHMETCVKGPNAQRLRERARPPREALAMAQRGELDPPDPIQETLL